MGQAVNIVINDGATTPVAHTFTPIGKDSKGVLWFEQILPVVSSPIAAKRISYTQTRVMDMAQKLTGRSKAIFVLYLPTTEVVGNSSTGITPPPTLSYTEVFRQELLLPERSALQERKDTRVLGMNLLANAQVVSAIDALQPMY